MPYEVAERGLKLFAKEVLPVLKAPSSAAAPKQPSDALPGVIMRHA
jgi:hypothetical protein